MDLQELLQYLALLNGKTGGQITGADLSRAEDPILGLMTNTYSQPENEGPNLANLSYQYRPTWESLLNDEYYDENSLEMQIARSISDGVPLMEIKKQIPQLLAASGQPSGPDDTTTKELIDFASNLDSENRNYNVAVTKANTDKSANTWWSKAGISDPSLRADPGQILNPQLQQLMSMYTPMADSNKTSGYMGSGGKYVQSGVRENQRQEATDKTRIQADARTAAETKMRNSIDAPYAYGGAPNFLDSTQLGYSAMMKDLTARIPGTPFYNPLAQLRAPVSYLSGLGGGLIDGMRGRDLTKADERKQAYVEDMTNKAADESLVGSDVPEEKRKKRSYKEDNREREMMLTRQNAMGNRSSSTIPIRTDLLNKQREDSMLRVASILSDRANRQAATMPSPAQNDVMSRILSLAIAERLKK